MSEIEIDMREFERYIRLINRIVNDICEANKAFAEKIISFEDTWNDDVYKEARNQIFRMQTPTNEFIDRLEELVNEKLIKWYRDYYERYYETTAYTLPVIDMGRVERINDVVKKADDKIKTSPETMEEYVQSNHKYTAAIRELLTELFQSHTDFAEYFQSRRYEEITEDLQKPANAINEILYEMDGLAEYGRRRIEAMRNS